MSENKYRDRVDVAMAPKGPVGVINFSSPKWGCNIPENENAPATALVSIANQTAVLKKVAEAVGVAELQTRTHNDNEYVSLEIKGFKYIRTAMAKLMPKVADGARPLNLAAMVEFTKEEYNKKDGTSVVKLVGMVRGLYAPVHNYNGDIPAEAPASTDPAFVPSPEQQAAVAQVDEFFADFGGDDLPF